MKGIMVIIFIVASCCIVTAQVTKKATPKKASVKIYKNTQQGQSLPQAPTTAIDSFKRTLRYSPGRPYETKDSQNVITEAINAESSSINSKVDNRPPSSQGANTANKPIQADSQSAAGVERNKADVNQLPVNENSKNTVETMNSSQINTLNNNQMAPPPANWGNTRQPNNWGRNTVGENQWNPGENISQRFLNEYPGVTNATWMRDNRDSLNAIVRYQTGNNWSTSTYTPDGVRLDTRTELPLSNLLQPVLLYTEKQRANNPQLQKITRINRPGKSDLFEIVLANGKAIFINDEGVETGL